MSRFDVSAWSGVRLAERAEDGHRNDVWSGWSPDGRVSIRRSRRSPASLAWELELLQELSYAGFVVPTPLLTDDGSLSVHGVVVQHWIDGREPHTDHEWRSVADELQRLHEMFAGHRQRPGCTTVTGLDRTGRSVDADVAALPADVADDVLAVFAAFAEVGGADTSVIHGDPGRTNVRITHDGRVGLLDWDESRVDIVDLDLANLAMQVLDDRRHRRAQALADAWETVNAWTVEPDYARRRLAALRAR